MNPQENPNSPATGTGKEVHNPLAAMRPGERVVAEIKRHPIGLLGVYVSGVILIALAAAAAVLIPHYATDLSSSIDALIVLGAVIVAAIACLYVFVGAKIYAGNRWIITNDSITQVSQTGLFHRQSSQLSMANLEDVTAEQLGIFQSMFGYGTLRVETAGERSKFVFPFCPNPNQCARAILEAREEFIATNPGESKPVNSSYTSSTSDPQTRVSFKS